MSTAILSFSHANPLRYVITSWAGLVANDRKYKMFRDFSLPTFDSYFQSYNKSDVVKIQFDSSFTTTNVVKVKNYYTYQNNKTN